MKNQRRGGFCYDYYTSFCSAVKKFAFLKSHLSSIPVIQISPPFAFGITHTNFNFNGTVSVGVTRSVTPTDTVSQFLNSLIQNKIHFIANPSR